MSIQVICDVCSTVMGGPGISTNPDGLKTWKKQVKVKIDGRKYVVNVDIEADASDSDPSKKDFEHICKPCARDKAKQIVSEIVNV